jgi:hypothetical protein
MQKTKFILVNNASLRYYYKLNKLLYCIVKVYKTKHVAQNLKKYNSNLLLLINLIKLCLNNFSEKQKKFALQVT